MEATSILPPRTEDCTLKAWYLFLFAGDGKPEPSAAETLRGRGISLAELLEQFCLLLRSHADAGVGDGELDEAAAIADLACHKPDLARFGELARIAEEIEQDLPQPHGVHGQCAEVLLGVNDASVLRPRRWRCRRRE